MFWFQKLKFKQCIYKKNSKELQKLTNIWNNYVNLIKCLQSHVYYNIYVLFKNKQQEIMFN